MNTVISSALMEHLDATLTATGAAVVVSTNAGISIHVVLYVLLLNEEIAALRSAAHAADSTVQNRPTVDAGNVSVESTTGAAKIIGEAPSVAIPFQASSVELTGTSFRANTCRQNVAAVPP